MYTTQIVGGALPGTVEWLSDNDAIVTCDGHADPMVPYAAACHEGADLELIVVSHMGGNRYYVGLGVDVDDECLKAWEDAAAEAGDAATMLIAGIARGEPARGLAKMTPAEIEAEWPTVTDSSSGDEIAHLVRHGWLLAARIAESWGSP